MDIKITNATKQELEALRKALQVSGFLLNVFPSGSEAELKRCDLAIQIEDNDGEEFIRLHHEFNKRYAPHTVGLDRLDQGKVILHGVSQAYADHVLDQITYRPLTLKED